MQIRIFINIIKKMEHGLRKWLSSLCGFLHLQVSHKCVEIRSPTIRKYISYGFQRISKDNLFIYCRVKGD